MTSTAFAFTGAIVGLLAITVIFLLGRELEREGRFVYEQQDTSTVLRGCAWFCAICVFTGALLMARHLAVAAAGKLQQTTTVKTAAEAPH